MLAGELGVLIHTVPFSGLAHKRVESREGAPPQKICELFLLEMVYSSQGGICRLTQ